MKKLLNLLGTILLFFVVYSFINPARSLAYDELSVTSIVDLGGDVTHFNFASVDVSSVTTCRFSSIGTSDVLIATEITPTYCTFSTTDVNDFYVNGNGSNGTINFQLLDSGEDLLYDQPILNFSSYNYPSYLYPTDTPIPSPVNTFSGNIDPSQQAKINGAIGSIPETAMQEWLSILLESLPWLLVMIVVLIGYAWIKYFMKKAKENSHSGGESGFNGSSEANPKGWQPSETTQDYLNKEAETYTAEHLDYYSGKDGKVHRSSL